MVAVSIPLNVGGKQELGGLAAQVIGGLVIHTQHHKERWRPMPGRRAVEAVFGQGKVLTRNR